MNPDLLDRFRNACSNGDLTLVRDILQSINNNYYLVVTNTKI